MSPERYVVDTNVLISAALLADSVPARCVFRVLQQGRLLFSEATFGELHTRLWRPKFDRYVSMEDRKLLLRDLQGVADWLEPGPQPQAPICADPDDQKFIQLAMAGRAHAVISGDRDLLTLGHIGTAPVLTPAQALRRFGTQT